MTKRLEEKKEEMLEKYPEIRGFLEIESNGILTLRVNPEADMVRLIFLPETEEWQIIIRLVKGNHQPEELPPEKSFAKAFRQFNNILSQVLAGLPHNRIETEPEKEFMIQPNVIYSKEQLQNISREYELELEEKRGFLILSATVGAERMAFFERKKDGWVLSNIVAEAEKTTPETEEDWQPYSEEWCKEMLHLEKEDLIGMCIIALEEQAKQTVTGRGKIVLKTKLEKKTKEQLIENIRALKSEN